MIKHVVLFQLKEFPSAKEKNTKLNEIKAALEALPSKIAEIKSLEVGLNANPDEKYDIALITSFNGLEELNIYAKHPDHIVVAGIIRPVLEKRACVDYQF